MTNSIFKQIRSSHLVLNEVYFWTSTIKDWHHLLKEDCFKQAIIDSLLYLVKRKKITIYAFVIMPNHVHLLWELNELNGKEMPHASFSKFTAHQFLKMALANNILKKYEVPDKERKHRFWQRDSMAIKIDSKITCEQKLDYIHLNPLQEKWNLAEYPENYKWSSASFYQSGIDGLGLLTHYMDRF